MAVLHIIMDKSHATPENSHSLPAAAERSPAPGDVRVDALRRRVGDPLRVKHKKTTVFWV
jgi:hypothetical protein